MAAKTPASTKQENLGSVTLKMFTFTDIDDADTFASAVVGIVNAWFNRTDDPTQGTEGVGVSVSGSDITFNTGEDDITGTLFMLCKSI